MSKLARNTRSVKSSAKNFPHGKKPAPIEPEPIEQAPVPIDAAPIEQAPVPIEAAQALYQRRVASLEANARGAFSKAAEWTQRRTKAREKEGALSIEAEAFYQAQISHYRSIAEDYRARLAALVAPEFVREGEKR